MVEPNYESIVISNAMALVLLACLVASSYMTRQRRHLDDRIFTAMVALTAGSCFFEPVTWLSDGNPGFWPMFFNYAGNTYCYLAACVTPYIWVLYVDLRLHKGVNRILNWHPAVLVPVIALTLLNVGNLFGHYMFQISDENVYSRLPLSYLNYIMMFAQFFYSVYLKHSYQRRHGRVEFFPMWIFLVPITIGAALQAAMFGVSLAWASVSIGLVAIHMSLQNELSFIDPLTSLYNRAYLESSLRTREHGGESFGAAMVDLDFFKDINDTFGHSIGDDALVSAAQLLAGTAPEGALVTRFAGDEFIIVVPKADDEAMERLKGDLERAAVDFNATSGAEYKLELSVGYSVYDTDGDTLDDLMRRIDQHMYEEKRAHHAGRTRYSQ